MNDKNLPLAYDAAVYKLVDKTLRKGMYKTAKKGFYPENQHKKQAFSLLMKYNLVDLKGYDT